MKSMIRETYLLSSFMLSLYAHYSVLQTPLHYAIAKKNISMIDSLIKAGANVNLADSDGATPCIAATKENLFAAVKSLISKYSPFLCKQIEVIHPSYCTS